MSLPSNFCKNKKMFKAIACAGKTPGECRCCNCHSTVGGATGYMPCRSIPGTYNLSAVIIELFQQLNRCRLATATFTNQSHCLAFARAERKPLKNSGIRSAWIVEM